MAIQKFKPTTPSRRNMALTDYSALSKVAPERSLLEPMNKTAEKYGITVYGSYDPKNLGLTNRDFYDGLHVRSESLSKILPVFN